MTSGEHDDGAGGSDGGHRRSVRRWSAEHGQTQPTSCCYNNAELMTASGCSAEVEEDVYTKDSLNTYIYSRRGEATPPRKFQTVDHVRLI